jgi:hypothetical protein
MAGALTRAVAGLVGVEACIRQDMAEYYASDAVDTALGLVLDAASELRGELRSREPERPLVDAERVVLTKREVLG